jgi:hypothetical protein
MSPFKLSPKYRDSEILFEVAEDFFGAPVSWSVEGDGVLIHKKEWNFQDEDHYHFLEVEHRDGADIPSINITSERMAYPGRRWIPGTFPNRLSNFVNKVKKPWDDWTEEELLSDPMWIVFLSLDGYTSDVLHSAMVMWSYERPDDPWIKRYFKECQRSVPKSHEGSRHALTTPSSMPVTS